LHHGEWRDKVFSTLLKHIHDAEIWSIATGEIVMRTATLIIGCVLLTACGSATSPDNSTASDAERRTIAQRADNPDFSAVEALANATTPTHHDTPATRPLPVKKGASDAFPVVTDPVAATRAAIAVSASGDGDGLKTLPLAPALLVAYRRHEKRTEVGNYDHDFLTGMQETLPLRVAAITSRRTAAGIEVSSRTVTPAGSRDMVAIWSPRGDGSWQLEDIRAEGTTLSALLASDDD
jgi:hypothetical protein